MGKYRRKATLSTYDAYFQAWQGVTGRCWISCEKWPRSRSKKLHVIGGGSKNALLNRMTADVIGIPVVAGPSEATAIGNCMVQAKAAGIVTDRNEMRRLIARCVPTETFIPGKTNIR